VTVAPASIDELGARLRAGEVTAVALAEQALRAIERAQEWAEATLAVAS
jgi:Asp-tRNA(Asn)/Glu-tRNA(Gln) amidotransferase A subunit family amidase